MAELTARFRMVDELSGQMASVAAQGQAMARSLEDAGQAAGSAMDGVADGVASIASSADGVAQSISEASEQTGNWTSKVGNLSKEALEAIYSTEELVEMGYKTADAMDEMDEMMDLCDRSARSLNLSMEHTSEIHDSLARSMENADDVAKALGNDLPEEDARAMAEASREAAEALEQLEAAQEEADAAMEHYDEVLSSGTDDLVELEEAAGRAIDAAEALAEANGRATDATAGLNETTNDAVESVERSRDSISAVAEGLAGVGILAVVKEATQALYGLADAYSSSMEVVANSSGATGAALESLGDSMMGAWSGSTASLGDTASAIGELNTRLGLTGDELTDTTSTFLKFSSVTGVNATEAIQSVTQIMRQWGVEAEGMEGLLDKLTYAGQTSGISVQRLGEVLAEEGGVFQGAGLSLDSTIQMLSSFELAGIDTTTAVTALNSAVSEFAKDGASADEAMAKLITSIQEAGTESEQNAIAVEAFGQDAGIQLAAAIRQGVVSVETFSGTMDKAHGTLDRTAEASESLSEKWQKATNSISAALTAQFEPALSGISEGLAGLVQGIADFMGENQQFADAVGAAAVGIGVVAGALGVYAGAVGVARVATKLLGDTIKTSLPVVAGITAAISGIAFVASQVSMSYDELNGETADMTATTREQYYELQDLNAEYERAVEEHGELSDEASSLKYQVDELSRSFEENRQTVDEFTAEADSISQAASEISSGYEDAMRSISSDEAGTLSLIQRMRELSAQSRLTSAESKELEAVTGSLAEKFPELGLSVDRVRGNTEQYAMALKKACEEEAKQRRLEQSQDAYIDALAKRQELTDEIAKAEENVRIEQERMDSMDWLDHMLYTDEWDDLEAYQAALDELNAASEENENTIAEIEGQWEDLAKEEEEAAAIPPTYQEAAATAFQSVQEELTALATAYDEAYNAAKESMDGQFGLFEEASTASEEYMGATVANATAALESQLSYWEGYLANIQTLKDTSAADLGITEENYALLMSYVQDGSEQAAGLASSMVAAIESGNTQAVTKLAETAGEVESTKEEISTEVADWQTSFEEEMDAIVKKMDETVDGLNLDEEATASAKATIEAYAKQIAASGGDAVAAAQAIADQVAAVLSGGEVPAGEVYSGGEGGSSSGESSAKPAKKKAKSSGKATEVSAYAGGTTGSDDVFIAGESGPELIVGKAGSTVFPAEETERIIGALDDRSRPLSVGTDRQSGSSGQQAAQRQSLEQTKRITLDINGSGRIGLGGGTTPEAVLGILQENMRPVLMQILQSEIYEEGDLSYEY